MTEPAQPDPPPSGLIGRLVAGARAAVASPVEAASRTLVDGAKDYGRTARDVGIFVLVTLVGYVFAMLALGSVLADSLGVPATFALIGGVNLTVGIIGIIVVVRRGRPESATSVSHDPR